MIDYHVILRAIFDQNENNVQTRGGHTSEQGKKRNETSAIGRKERGLNMIFSQVAKVCLFLRGWQFPIDSK